MLTWFRSWYLAIPISILGVLLVILLLFAGSFGNKPHISRIDPLMGPPGEVLVIEGANFRDDDLGSWVSIGGRRIASANFLEWTNRRVSFRIPYNVYSGLVRVHTPSGVAQGTMFVNSDQLPQLLGSRDREPMMWMRSIEPTKLVPGQVAMIRGRGFGAAPLDRSLSINGRRIPPEDLVLWSEGEIRFVAPWSNQEQSLLIEGTTEVSGALELPAVQAVVPTVRGRGRTWEIELSASVGDIELGTGAWGSVLVYLPRPPVGIGQQAKFLASRGGFERETNPGSGFDMYVLPQAAVDRSHQLQAVWQVELQSLSYDFSNVELPPQNIPSSYSVWTGQTIHVPIHDQALQDRARLIARANSFPLERVRASYAYVIEALDPDPTQGLAFAATALKDGAAQSFGYTNLLVALLRLQGIPARIVEGLWLGNEDPIHNHYWAEAYLTGLGWIELDPYLVDFMPASAPSFGARDGYHLALVQESRLPSVASLDQKAIKVFGRFVLMDAHGLARGNIESFGLGLDQTRVRSLGISPVLD